MWLPPIPPPAILLNFTRLSSTGRSISCTLRELPDIPSSSQVADELQLVKRNLSEKDEAERFDLST